MDAVTVKAYDLHAAEFAERYAQADVTALQQLLLRYLTPECRVLEVGCGSGRDAAFLAQHGFAVTATDASAEMLAAARKAWPTLAHGPESGTPYPPGFRLLPATFPLPADAPLLRERFDAVVVLAVVMHVPDQDLFEFAFQLRQLLNPRGTVILSISEGHAVNAESRDEQGRLFRERPPAELALLFERLGFRLLAREPVSDGLDRADIRWTSLLLRLDAAIGTRPVDQIETIINRDKKTATYKLALLRALCDIAQTSCHQVRWYADDTVSLPLGLIAEKWLYYYWPLLEADRLLPQIRGAGVSIAFSGELKELIGRFRKQGGLNAFHVAFQSGGLNAATSALADSALNQIARTIVDGPVTHAGSALEGEDRFFWPRGAQSAANRCSTPDGLVSALGQVHFRAEVWRELCLVGHWIGEAIILRWAELTHKFSKRDVSVAEVVAQLLQRPELERDSVLASRLRDLFGAITGLSCVWTNNPLTIVDLAVDHVIPFALWHNNDLWNLVPAAKRENNRKRDKLVARHKLIESRERIIDCWRHTRAAMPQRFDVELNRTLFGRNFAETQWEMPAFAALVEAVETVAIQRGVERWEPGMTSRAGRRARSVADSATTAAASVSTATPSRAEGLVLVPFADLAKDEPFMTALPLVADLAAGSLNAGFEAGTLDAWTEFDWLRVPAEFARRRRFVVRLAGDSMEPTLHKGDLVVFEYHRTPRKDGDVVIVADFSAGAASGECAVKRFGTDPVDWLFTSDNRAYPEIRFTRAAQDYPILGVMVARLSADA